MVEKYTDSEILDGLAKNKSSVIDFVYKNYYNLVRTMVLNNSGDEDDAADLFQETMVIMFNKAKNGDLELDCQLKTYVFSVARNQWLKQLRAKSTKKTVELKVDNEDYTTVDSDIELFKKKELDFENMALSLGKLGEPCKSILEAYYIKKMNMSSIAEEFGYTNPENAKTQKYKCLIRLKKIFFNTK